MEMELHFPKELAEDYVELNPSYSIFDSPFTEGIDTEVSFHVRPGFRVVYRKFREYFRKKVIGKDLKVYHYDENDNKIYYDVTCTLRKYYQIERLIFTHAVLTYRHPIARFLLEYNISLDLDIDVYDKIALVVDRAEITFPLSGGSTAPVLHVYIPKNLFPIAMSKKDIVPLSITSQLMYSISRFMVESGLFPENQATYLESECDWYEKRVEQILQSVKKEIDQLIKGEKLTQLIKTLWEGRYVKIEGDEHKFTVGIDLDTLRLINDFNAEHETEFDSNDVLQALHRFVRTKRIVYEDDEWRLKV
jgi:hypothetical protein